MLRRIAHRSARITGGFMTALTAALLLITFGAVALTPDQRAVLLATAASFVTANQGAPNAGGALAWPVVDSALATQLGLSAGATGASAPSQANYIGANSSGLLTGVIQADTSVAINISTATTTQLVALSNGKKIYVMAWDVVAGGTGNITLEYGTGSTCGTGTTTLTGAYNLTAQAGIAKGNGLGPVLVIPAGNALCALTSAGVQMSGSLAYTQF